MSHEPPATQDERLLTVQDVRQQLSLGVTTIYKLIAQGRLKRVKIGASTRITRSSVRALLDAGAWKPERRTP